MNTQQNQGFNFNLTINSIETINPRLEGDMISNGEEVVWGHAVKFITSTLEEETDADGMVKDIEVRLEIEISCDTKSEVIKLNNFLRQWRNDPKPFKCEVHLPKSNNKQYKTKAIFKGDKFITLFDKK